MGWSDANNKSNGHHPSKSGINKLGRKKIDELISTLPQNSNGMNLIELDQEEIGIAFKTTNGVRNTLGGDLNNPHYRTHNDVSRDAQKLDNTYSDVGSIHSPTKKKININGVKLVKQGAPSVFSQAKKDPLKAALRDSIGTLNLNPTDNSNRSVSRYGVDSRDGSRRKIKITTNKMPMTIHNVNRELSATSKDSNNPGQNPVATILRKKPNWLGLVSGGGIQKAPILAGKMNKNLSGNDKYQFPGLHPEDPGMQGKTISQSYKISTVIRRPGSARGLNDSTGPSGGSISTKGKPVP
jgi:hypothetical protein